MLIINAFRDFAGGLARSFSLFFTERGDYNECLTIPEAALTKCLLQGLADSTGTKPR